MSLKKIWWAGVFFLLFFAGALCKLHESRVLSRICTPTHDLWSAKFAHHIAFTLLCSTSGSHHKSVNSQSRKLGLLTISSQRCHSRIARSSCLRKKIMRRIMNVIAFKTSRNSLQQQISISNQEKYVGSKGINFYLRHTIWKIDYYECFSTFIANKMITRRHW